MFKYEHLKYFCCHVALFSLLSFLLIATTKDNVAAQQLGTPADDFTRYSVVQPVVHHGRSKREITSTRDTAGEHHKQVTVTVNVDGEEYVLDLSLNEQLVSRDHVISYQENGQTVLQRPKKEELDICQYSGTVRGKPGSWVAVSTCRGISGVIYDGHSAKYIEPAGEGVNGQHFLYDHADLKTTHVTHKNDKNDAPENNVISQRLNRHPSEQILERGSSRLKREAESFNFEKRYVELVMVADNSLFKNKSESVDNVNRYFMDITNVLNSLYAPLNISITLVHVVVWKERDEIHTDNDIHITLDNFATYRNTDLLPVIINDFAELVTPQVFNDSYVGSTFVGEICTDNKTAGVSSTFSPVVGRMATLIARHLGYNLGMNINKKDCDCRGEHCIMDRYTLSEGVNQTQWSDCNKRELADSYAKGKDYCLRNVPGPVCGDGLVQAGEQCDCGPDPPPACAECCHPRHCTRATSPVCRLRSLPDTSKTTAPDITPLIELLSLYKDQSDMKMKVCIEF